MNTETELFIINEIQRTKQYVSNDRILEDIEDLKKFRDLLSNGGFNHVFFASLRRRVGSQALWGTLVPCAQATIGNWERDNSAPDPLNRSGLARTCDILGRFLQKEIERRSPQNRFAADLAETREKLHNSILKASLDDFSFDRNLGQVVPIPFQGDFAAAAAEIEQQREELIQSLEKQAESIWNNLSVGQNIVSDTIRDEFREYYQNAQSNKPNPRHLNRIGDTISAAVQDEDLRLSLNKLSLIKIEGFIEDHNELMRLYFRVALARAQEIEMAPIGSNEAIPTSETFFEAALAVEGVLDENGRPVVDEGIPTMLRVFGREVQRLEEAERSTSNPERLSQLQRQRIEAAKTGSVYIGRFVFCTSLFVTAAASSPATVSAISSVVTIVEALSPGSVRLIYDSLREFLPILPRLPVIKDASGRH